MEANTVVLPLERYEELKKMEENLLKKKITLYTLVPSYSGYGGGYSLMANREYYTKEEVIKRLVSESNEKTEEIVALKNENRELHRKLDIVGYKEDLPITIEDIKKMTYWQFKKWKRQK